MTVPTDLTKCLNCGHLLDQHTGHNCGLCEVGFHIPEAAPCRCKLMGHPEYIPTGAGEWGWVPSAVLPGVGGA